MTALREPLNLGDLLKFEAPNLYSRDLATVAAGQVLKLGAVVAFDTSSKLVALDPTAGDSRAEAVGVLANDIDASLIDRPDALLIAREAIVASHALTWPTGITPAQQATAIAQLQARGVLVRTAA